MGTSFRLVLYAPDRDSASRASRAAFNRIARLDAIMSDYSETSELASLCRRAGAGPVRVSEDLFRVLTVAQEMAWRSDGAFDVTVGPVSRLWRRVRRTGQLPGPGRLELALALVDYRSLELDAENSTARLAKAGMLLDLGGIAKGFAADEAMAVIKSHGITTALVAAGGDIAASGKPPGTSGWNIGVATAGSSDKTRRMLVMGEGAVSTSGDAEQHIEIGGTRYSHIVDPRSALPLTGRRSVTVAAPSCMLSDSLATAVSVLGPKKGLDLVEATAGASALIVVVSGDGVREYRSSRWREATPPKKTARISTQGGQGEKARRPINRGKQVLQVSRVGEAVPPAVGP